MGISGNPTVNPELFNPKLSQLNPKMHPSYAAFLEWSSGSAVAVSDAPAGHREQRNMTNMIIRCIEHNIKKGVDLISLFGRYDSKVVGRVSADEFCAVLADLGLSSVTQKDVLDVAEIFKAAPGSNFIMYRRLVTELLQKVDDASGAGDIDIVDVICNSLLKKRIPLSKFRTALERYDSKLVGKIRGEDLGIALEELRVLLRRQELEGVSNRYAAGDSYYVDYQALLSDLYAKMGNDDMSPSGVSGELVSKLRGHLEALIARGVDFLSAFDRFSDNHDGCVLQSDFKDILGQLKMSFQPQEVQSLSATYRDLSDPRKVNYSKMLASNHPLVRSDRVEDLEITTIAGLLRSKIRRRCEFAVPGELKRPYAHFCGKQSKFIDRESFSIGLRDIGIRIDGEQERSLFELIKLGEARVISYSDFKVFVCDPFHSDIIWKYNRIKKRSGISDRDLVEAIRNLDADESNMIKSQQCSAMFQKCGMEFSESGEF